MICVWLIWLILWIIANCNLSKLSSEFCISFIKIKHINWKVLLQHVDKLDNVWWRIYKILFPDKGNIELPQYTTNECNMRRITNGWRHYFIRSDYNQCCYVMWCVVAYHQNVLFSFSFSPYGINLIGWGIKHIVFNVVQ